MTGEGRSQSHVCDDTCAHTVDVGFVHTPSEQGGPCLPTCPHPNHKPAVYNWPLTDDAEWQTP